MTKDVVGMKLHGIIALLFLTITEPIAARTMTARTQQQKTATRKKAQLVSAKRVNNQRPAQPWTYRREFAAHLYRENDIVTTNQQQVPAFSQLMISWNALRPKQGYFLFEAAVQYADGHWSTWMPLARWGARIQQTLESQDKRGAKNYYVRVEMPEHNLGIGYNIRVRALKGAPIEDLHTFLVTTSDFGKMTSDVSNTELKGLPLKIIDGVPRYTQMIPNYPDARKICSPTSLSMLLGHTLKRRFQPYRVAKLVWDDGLKVWGSWQMNTAAAYPLIQQTHHIYATRLSSAIELYANLVQNRPVCVSIRGPLPGAAPIYTQRGHIIVVVGMDPQNNRIIVNDPAFESLKEVQHTYRLTDFLRAWELSHRLAYILVPKTHILDDDPSLQEG